MDKDKQLNLRIFEVLKKGEFLIPAAAKLFEEPTRTHKLLEILSDFVEKGEVGSAMETAEALGRKLSKGELETMLKKSVADGIFRQSKELAVLLERDLSREELTELLENTKSIDVSREIAKLLLA